MAKAFSVASWNVENLGRRDTIGRIPDVIDFIKKQDADIVAIYEVASTKTLFRPLTKAMPRYSFHITEGPQSQEILVGIKNGISVFVTQKLTFKSGQTYLRPGLLVTPFIDDEYYPLLFLHLKSSPEPKGFGLRDDMIDRAYKFKKALDDSAGKDSNYIFLGDLNTMGLDYPYAAHDISAEDEIKELKRRVRYNDMSVLEKSSPFTWWNGPNSNYAKANLDHVVAADQLSFKDFSGSPVDVRGWPNENNEQKQADWIKKYSDHALLYFEVQKV